MSSGKVATTETTETTETTKKESKVGDYIDPQEVNKLSTDMERDNLVRQKTELVESQTRIYEDKTVRLLSDLNKFNGTMTKHKKYVNGLVSQKDKEGKVNRHKYDRIKFNRGTKEITPTDNFRIIGVWDWNGHKTGTEVKGSLQIEKIVHNFQVYYDDNSAKIKDYHFEKEDQFYYVYVTPESAEFLNKVNEPDYFKDSIITLTINKTPHWKRTSECKIVTYEKTKNRFKLEPKYAPESANNLFYSKVTYNNYNDFLANQLLEGHPGGNFYRNIYQGGINVNPRELTEFRKIQGGEVGERQAEMVRADTIVNIAGRAENVRYNDIPLAGTLPKLPTIDIIPGASPTDLSQIQSQHDIDDARIPYKKDSHMYAFFTENDTNYEVEIELKELKANRLYKDLGEFATTDPDKVKVFTNETKTQSTSLDKPKELTVEILSKLEKDLQENKINTVEKEKEARSAYLALLKPKIGEEKLKPQFEALLQKFSPQLTSIMKKYETKMYAKAKDILERETTKGFPFQSNNFTADFDTPLNKDDGEIYATNKNLMKIIDKLKTEFNINSKDDPLWGKIKPPSKGNKFTSEKIFTLVSGLITKEDETQNKYYNYTAAINLRLHPNSENPFDATFVHHDYYNKKEQKLNYEAILKDIREKGIVKVWVRNEGYDAAATDVSIANCITAVGAGATSDNLSGLQATWTYPRVRPVPRTAVNFPGDLADTNPIAKELKLVNEWPTYLKYLEGLFDPGTNYQDWVEFVTKTKTDTQKIFTDKVGEYDSELAEISKKGSTPGKEIKDLIKADNNKFIKVCDILSGPVVSLIFYGGDANLLKDKYKCNSFTPEIMKKLCNDNVCLWTPFNNYTELMQSTETNLGDDKLSRMMIDTNSLWFDYVNKFLPFLKMSNQLNLTISDKDHIKKIPEFKIQLRASLNQEKFNFDDKFTCDNSFKNEKESFWVDPTGFMENTTLDYMNLKYSLERDIKELKGLFELNSRNNIALGELKRLVEKKRITPLKDLIKYDPRRLWYSKELVYEALDKFNLEQYWKAIGSLGYDKAMNFEGLKYSSSQSTTQPTSTKLVGGGEGNLFDIISSKLNLSADEKINLGKAVDYVHEKLQKELEKVKEKEKEVKPGVKPEVKPEVTPAKIPGIPDKKELKPELLKPEEVKVGLPGEEVEPGVYSDEDITELKDDLKKTTDELNVKKIMMRNMLSEIDNYKQNRSHSFNLVKEKLLQELEVNKKDIHRLKKKKESRLQQIRYIKLFMEEEKKRSDIKLKQQQDYLQLENEKKIQQLQKIHQQMTLMMQNKHEEELEQSSELYDKETKKKLDKYKKEINYYRNYSSLMNQPTKSEDLYDYPPIHTTHKPRKTARKVRKGKEKRKKVKKEKRSLTKSLRKMIGL